MRNRLVCGLQNEQIQWGLLAKADLDLVKAVKRTTAMDVALSQGQAMKAPQQVVGRVDTTPGRAAARSAGSDAVVVETWDTMRANAVSRVLVMDWDILMPDTSCLAAHIPDFQCKETSFCAHACVILCITS